MMDIFDSWGYAYAIGLSPVLLPKVALCGGCWHTMQGGYLLLIGIAYVILLVRVTLRTSTEVVGGFHSYRPPIHGYCTGLVLC